MLTTVVILNKCKCEISIKQYTVSSTRNIFVEKKKNIEPNELEITTFTTK